MNKVILTGRLVKDIETATSQSGKTFARFSLAVNRRTRDDGADFLNCVAFGQTAENMAKYLAKGSKIGIVGRVQSGSYEKEGRKIYYVEIICDEVEFLESRKAVEEATSEAAPGEFTEVPADDLPF